MALDLAKLDEALRRADAMKRRPVMVDGRVLGPKISAALRADAMSRLQALRQLEDANINRLSDDDLYAAIEALKRDKTPGDAATIRAAEKVLSDRWLKK